MQTIKVTYVSGNYIRLTFAKEEIRVKLPEGYIYSPELAEIVKEIERKTFKFPYVLRCKINITKHSLDKLKIFLRIRHMKKLPIYRIETKNSKIKVIRIINRRTLWLTIKLFVQHLKIFVR